MARLPTNDPQLLEMLDCCRPGSQDREDPALSVLAAELGRNADLAQLAQRIETVDVKLTSAFQDVAVPEGLAERILARLASPPMVVSLPDLGQSGVRLPDLRQPGSATRRSARHWYAAATISAIAAVCLLAAIIPSFRKPVLRPAEILDGAVALFTSESAVEGRTDTSPADHPFSRDVLQLRGTRWRAVASLLGRSGVAYDLPAIEGSRATLYVVRARSDGLSASPPQRPLFNTGDCSVAAWQDGELLYVLAVRGGADVYQRYVDLPGGPMASVLRLPLRRAA